MVVRPVLSDTLGKGPGQITLCQCNLSISNAEADPAQMLHIGTQYVERFESVCCLRSFKCVSINIIKRLAVRNNSQKTSEGLRTMYDLILFGYFSGFDKTLRL